MLWWILTKTFQWRKTFSCMTVLRTGCMGELKSFDWQRWINSFLCRMMSGEDLVGIEGLGAREEERFWKSMYFRSIISSVMVIPNLRFMFSSFGFPWNRYSKLFCGESQNMSFFCSQLDAGERALVRGMRTQVERMILRHPEGCDEREEVEEL